MALEAISVNSSEPSTKLRLVQSAEFTESTPLKPEPRLPVRTWDTGAMSRYQDWLRRVMFGEKVGLGFLEEFWGPIHEHQAYSNLVELGAKHGREPEDMKYYATRSLLNDVIHAVGGMEYSVSRLEALMGEGQEFAESADKAFEREEPDPAIGVQVPFEISWEYANLMSWTRALEERMGRRARAGGSGELGLLPAMHPEHPATEEVRRAWTEFHLRPLLTDVRRQANVGLHATTIHGVMPVARRRQDGQIVVDVPDPLLSQVMTRDELTFEEHRDLMSFSHQLFNEVSDFIDTLLDIFARCTRDRQNDAKDST
jgi:hypothetical protein